MQFDVIIGNPPYQNSQSGSRKGSSSNPLWWQFVKLSFEYLKPNGYISFVTPSVVVNGGRQFTKFFLGQTAKHDLVSIDFNADSYFDVGIEICSWSAIKREPTGNTVVDGDRVVDARLETYVPSDSKLQSILQKLQNLDSLKLTFSQSKRYDYNVIERQLAESNKPVEWAKDLRTEKSSTHIYTVANNDKVKFSRIKPPNYGVWRVFVPQFVSKAGLKFWIDDKMGATGTTWTHVCSSEDEAKTILSYVSNPVYIALINALKVNSRITGLIRTLPAVDITNVLSKSECDYLLSL